MSVFVNISGKAPVYDHDAQRQIRSQAMKDFRQRQREAERQRWKNSIRAPASLSRDREESQPTPADRDVHGTGDIEVQISACVRADDETPKADHTVSTCVKQFSMPRFIPMPSIPPNEQRSCRRKATPPTRQYASKNPAGVAQASPIVRQDSSSEPSLVMQAYGTYLSKSIGSTVRSPEAQRQQLMVPFIDLHYSDAMPNLQLAFPKIQARLKPLRTGTKTAATDAVLLQALAISSKNDSIMWAAKRKNNEAIGGLRYLLSSCSNHASDGMLLTTDALAFFDAGSTRWRQHAAGLSALILVRGPKLYETFPFMLHALVFQLLGDALLWHGSFVFGEARWLGAMLPTCQTRMTRLMHLGCRVPNITNQINQTEKMKSSHEMLLESINDLERSLQEWLSDWYLDKFHKRPPYTMVARTERLDVGLSASLDPLPLGGSYIFPSLREAFGHNCFWTLLLQVRQTKYKLLVSSPTISAAAIAAEQNAICEVADSICRSAPFILRAVSDLPSGLACSAGPLILAGRWYKACGKVELASWCFGTADMLTANMAQPPGWITRSCAAWITAAL
jgi:hypothetical protein